MRVLVTGIGSHLGSRLAAELERRPDVEAVVGVDTAEPQVPLERVEFVRAEPSYGLLTRLLRSTASDAVVHALISLDSARADTRRVTEHNVIATMNLFAACASEGTSVRRVAVLGSTYVYGTSHAAPYFVREEQAPTTPTGTHLEQSLQERERYARDFADDDNGVAVSIIRAADVLAPGADGPLAQVLARPFVPEVLGYDPRLQVVHENDVVETLLFALRRELHGVYNLAGEGTLPWSDICRMVGRRRVPLPPLLADVPAFALRALGALETTPELLGLLRWGRGVDVSRLEQLGIRPRHTTAGTVADVARAARLARTLGTPPRYRYAQDVEEFFRYSPAVVRRG